MDGADPWGAHAGHDLAWPRPRETWALWTRLQASRKSASVEEED